LDSAALQAEQERLVRQWPQPLKNDGMVKVSVRTAQGHTVPLWVTSHRRKGQRRAGKRHTGVYAGLVLLGIYDRCTPALASEVSLFAAMLGSLAEAQDVLATRGVELDTKTVRLIAYRYAARARLAQQVEGTTFADTVAGRRVVISSDGGRLRLREPKRGSKTKKGRRRYTGAWREPKVLIVYVVDAEGKQESHFAPFIDATLQGPDAVFALLCTYLQRLEITQADHVLFIADGAPWIWKRVPRLVHTLGLAAAQVHELLDFYHAVHRLDQVAALRKDWSAKARTRWRTHQRHLLMRGEVAQVIAAVRDLCRGRNSKAIRKHREYFLKNQHRMAYAQLMALKLPIGSGAIESAIRRVVNLRLKGSSLFWCRASAEAILLLRSYYKAGRWNMLKRLATSHRALLAA
jgi:ribosomal protein L32